MCVCVCARARARVVCTCAAARTMAGGVDVRLESHSSESLIRVAGVNRCEARKRIGLVYDEEREDKSPARYYRVGEIRSESLIRVLYLSHSIESLI